MKIRTDKSKTIKFGYQTENVDPGHVRGWFRLIIEGVEYGFPVDTIDGLMIATIPPLESFVKEEILIEQKKIETKLEVIALDTCCCLWEDTLEVEKPIKIFTTGQEVEPKIKLGEVKEVELDAPILNDDGHSRKSKFREKLIS